MPPKPDERRISILPWVEASTLLGVTLIGAISVSSVSLYRIDEMADKVDKIAEAVASLTFAQGVTKTEILSLKHHDEETQKIFKEFSTAVRGLTIAVAKLEVKK